MDGTNLIASAQPILELENLSYSYKSHWLLGKTSAIRDINLNLRKGEVFGFLGPNGAGKTTTIKCILGLISPTKGTIKINGIKHTNPECRASVGFLPEQPYFYDHLTVQELVEMHAALAGLQGSRVKEASIYALERSKVVFKRSSPLRTLSKGLMQRVAMAQAIVAKPDLLILDEPFSGLDPVGRREFRELLSTLKDEGATIFMSSHILSDVEFLCDRASILIKGELKGLLDLKDLQKRASGTFVLILGNYQAVEETIRRLTPTVRIQGSTLRAEFKQRDLAEQAISSSLASGALIQSFEESLESLEDIFMNIVRNMG